MNEKELEAVWRSLGREERQLQETLATTRLRLRQYRADGEDAAADDLADAADALGRRLKELKRLIDQVEPLYFAAVNARLRNRHTN